MLENLAYLHLYELYERNEDIQEISFKPASTITLLLAVCAISFSASPSALTQSVQNSGFLKLGSQGKPVRLLQIQLDNWGFPLDGRRLRPTGKFDIETQKAVQEFKRYFVMGDNDIFNPDDSEILWTPRVVALVERLRDGTFPWIAPALENLKPTEKPEAIATILSILENSETYQDSVDVPDSAAALGILRADATITVPKLLTLLRDRQNHKFVRANAARALGYIGVDANQVIPALTAVATNKNEERGVRGDAMEAIGWFEADAVEPLLGILKDPTEDHRFRAIAAEALGFIGVDANQVIPALTAVATNKNEKRGVREVAVEAIGGFGADAKDAVEPLVEILKDPNEVFDLRNVVIEALGKMGSTAQAAIPTLMVLLDDQNYTALGLKNNFQRQTLNAELNETTIKPPSFRKQAALALAGIGSAAAPELIAALQNPDEKVRYSAVFALGRMQPPALSAVEPLKALMNNPTENPNVRWMAASALETMGQDTQRFFSQSSRQSLDTLEKQKCSPREIFEEYVGRCVGRFGEGGGSQIARRIRDWRKKRR